MSDMPLEGTDPTFSGDGGLYMASRFLRLLLKLSRWNLEEDTCFFDF